VVLWVEWSY